MNLQYRDTRGLLLPEDRIHQDMKDANVTEQQLIEFLGPERINQDGYVLNLLQTMGAMNKWYSRQESDDGLSIGSCETHYDQVMAAKGKIPT